MFNLKNILLRSTVLFSVLFVSCNTNKFEYISFYFSDSIKLDANQNSYDLNLPYSLRGGTIDRFNDLSTSEINHIFIKPFFGKKLKTRITKFLPIVLETASNYKIDPFWAFSIAMVESHFRAYAKSHKSAHGLYQLKGTTAAYLKKLTKDENPLQIYQPKENVNLGIYYLARLKKRFKSSRYATVAYNMGPTWTSRRLYNRKKVGNKNKYLDKVKDVYYLVVARYIKLEKIKKSYYRNAYVTNNKFLRKRITFIDRFFLSLLVKQQVLAYNN